MGAQDQIGFWSGLRELFRLLPAERRRQFSFVLLLMMAGAVAELATIGAVLPFLSLLADPHRAEQAPLIGALFQATGATGARERLMTTAGLFILLAIVAGLVRLQLTWSSQRFVFNVGHDLGVEIERRLLLQPYTFHINQNTSALIAAFEKVGVVVFNVLQQVMQAAVSAFIAICIVATLVYVDPFTALSAAAGFALVYMLVSALTRRRLIRNSDIIGAAYDERIKIVQESLGGIRDVIIDNSQAVYLDAFRRIDATLNSSRSNTSFLASAPRFIIESLGMVVIAALAVVISAREGGFAGALPILGALALGAQRLLPLLQQVYVGWTTAVGNGSLVAQILDLLRLPVPEDRADAARVQPLPLNDRIRLQDVSFAYPSRRGPVLHNIDIEIARGQRVALIGKTGSGKSTLADLLMGLLQPTAGRISIDGVPLTSDSLRRWQRSIAHVPQAIFLADASIARNIAFGIPENEIDQARVAEAARKAQLDDFVDALPQGLDTPVGERGVRLSGGQRQRLGIARAVYKKAPVLVLDEATSALDEATEAAVMHALDQLGEEGRTIIMIAHRLSTISRADVVIRLDNGRLVEMGSHEKVIGGTPQRQFF